MTSIAATLNQEQEQKTEIGKIIEETTEKVKKKYPETKLVIGFAETATAIALKVADTISSECYCINTTREVLPEGKDYTFWGKGVSQGHSDAIRRVEGVKNGKQYTIPVEAALEGRQIQPILIQ